MTDPLGLAGGFAIVAGATLGWLALPVVLLIGFLTGLISRPRPLLLAVMMVGAAVGWWRAEPDMPEVLVQPVLDSTGAVIEVSSFPRDWTDGTMVFATIREVELGNGSTRDVMGRVAVTFGDHVDLAPGDLLRVSWSVEPVAMVSPGYARWLDSQGALATARVWWHEPLDRGPAPLAWLVGLRRHVTTAMQTAVPGDAGALAAGIVTGDDSGLSDATRDGFLRTGTSHITAVSGSNVAMVLAIWTTLVPVGGWRRRASVRLLIAGSVWGYALLAGFEAPAVRASIMATLMLLASGTGRRPDPMTMLAIASGAMVMLNPGYVDSVSFWLSVVASAAIIGRVPSGGAPTWREAWRGMAEGVLAAQVATLPIVLLLFGSWSLTSVAANVVLAPVMWLAFPMCFVLAMIVAVAPWAGPVAALPTLVPLELAIALVRTLSTSSPAFAVPQSGLPGVVGVLGPALGLALLTSRDARRWVSRAPDRLVAQPLLVLVAVAGPLLGIAMAVGATLLWH